MSQLTISQQPVPQSVPFRTPPPGSAAGRRLLWLGIAVVALAFPFISEPGRYIADTRDAVWFAPWTYIANSFKVWQESPFLGHQQHEGILVPMALVIGLIRSTGLPIWMTERLWHALLLFAAAGGMALLIDQLLGRRTLLAGAIGALVYTVTPYTFGYGLGTSSAYIPYALLPLLMVVTVRWLPRSGVLGPVLFGLTVFLMGGGNGGPQAYALFPPLAYVLWMTFIERGVSWRQAARFVGLSLAFVVGLNGYWLFLLTSREVSNAFAYTEQPHTINVASSFSESIRGLGHWQFYGGDQFGPWIGNVRGFITAPLLIVSGFALSIGALLSAWLVRWRLRLFFVFLLILSVLVMAGTFPVTSSTPFGHVLLFAYRHLPGASGLRTTYKMGMVLNLSVAVLVAVGVDAAIVAVATRPKYAVGAISLGLVMMLVVTANAWPLWSGRMYRGFRSTQSVPAYWQRALRFLEDREAGYRAFFAPGELYSTYRWGGLLDSLPDASPALDSVRRDPVPVGQGYGSNLLAALEQVYQGDLPSQQAATLFRYLGARDVVLQDDIDWQRSHTARPAELETLAMDPSLEALATFGFPGQNVISPSALEGGTDAASGEGQLPPVQILTVPDPTPVLHGETSRPVVVSGDGFALPVLAGQGVLDGNPPVLYSGALTTAQLQLLLRDHSTFVITDSNRRRTWAFSDVRRNYSQTLPANVSIDASNRFSLFGDRTVTQTVAVYRGVRSVTASGYGTLFGYLPEYRASNAFDGDPNTWWIAGALSDPVGAWVQVSFDARTLYRVSLSVPDLGFGRQVASARLSFSDGSSVLTKVTPGTTDVEFEPRRTSFVRVQITSVTDAPFDNGVGFSEIGIDGVHVNEVLRVPVDLAQTLRRLPPSELVSLPLVFVFDRQRTTAPLVTDEERILSRLFEVPGNTLFRLRGIVRLDRKAADDAIDRAVSGDSPVQATSSSRLFGRPGVRASAALDGRVRTAWIPGGSVGEWLRVAFPEHVIDHVTMHALLPPGRSSISKVRVVLSDGSVLEGSVDPESGTAEVSFSPRAISSVTVTIEQVKPVLGANGPPVGFSEVQIPDVHVPRVKPRTPLQCSSDVVTLDGIQIPVRLESTKRALLRGREMPIATCDGAPLFLTKGLHELDIRGAVQGQTITLATAGALPAEGPANFTSVSDRPVMTARTRSDGYDVDVRGASGPFYFSIGQNYSPNWSASIGGRSLGPPLVLDGYSTGWRVTRKGSFRIAVRYRVQHGYETALALSGATLLLCLGLLAARLVRRRP